jgi:uncharacterized protein YqgC (DUF456 family)
MLLWILATVLVLAGIAGVFLPALPGTPLVFAGLLLGAWIDGFQRVGWPTLAALALLTVLSLVIDFLLSAVGARKMGAGRSALQGAVAGMVVGLFFGPLGLILGPFIGAFAGEYLAGRDLLRAGKAGLGTWLGLLGGIAVKLALSVAMVGIFVAAYFW